MYKHIHGRVVIVMFVILFLKIDVKKVLVGNCDPHLQRLMANRRGFQVGYAMAALFTI